jgi:hypothetical protein
MRIDETATYNWTYNAEGCGKYGIGMYISSKNPTDTEKN